MIRYTKCDGYTIREAPSNVRVREQLSNGQLLSVWFRRKRVPDPEGLICYYWTVSVHIGRTRQEANRWYHNWRSKSNKITGDGSIEGLKRALEYILAFANQFCGWRDELRIHGTDKKRTSAYRWLLRYPGFVQYAGEEYIAFRNPNIYKFIGKSS